MVVSLTGRCTFSSLSQYEELLDLIQRRSGCVYEMEVSGLEYIDSSGVGMWLMLQEACEKRRSRLIIRAPGPHVMQVLRLTHLDHVLTVEPE